MTVSVKDNTARLFRSLLFPELRDPKIGDRPTMGRAAVFLAPRKQPGSCPKPKNEQIFQITTTKPPSPSRARAHRLWENIGIPSYEVLLQLGCGVPQSRPGVIK